MNKFPLTEQSPAGTYYVVTHSRSVYKIVLDPDRQPQIIRYRAGGNISLHDGESLSGISAFRFDAVTGEGIVFWWKDPPEDRDDPEGPYAGSSRHTSLVYLILEDATQQASIAPIAPSSEWPEDVIQRIKDEDAGSLLDRIRLGLSGADDETFAAFVNTIIASQV